MSIKHPLKILVAPLDWGLGHSTRCIPVIRHLIHRQCQVYIACEGASYSLLVKEFPEALFLPLKGYRVQYTNSKRLLPLKILCQLPKIALAVRSEHIWLAGIVQTLQINLVISDNRYGLWNPHISCIFITHQLLVKGPNKWIEKLIQHINYKHVNRYTACWVPDYEGEPNLAGELSHPQQMPAVPVHYLGPLSRLQHQPAEYMYDVLVLLSGPEPQRTRLEQMIVQQLACFSGNAMLVRGMPSAQTTIPAPTPGVVVQNHLAAAQLQQAVAQSRLVIARSGYTTVMDLLAMQKKAVLVPTPGQTEQEYLARHLEQHHWCAYLPQQQFTLEKALHKANCFAYRLPTVTMHHYRQVIDTVLSNLPATGGHSR